MAETIADFQRVYDEYRPRVLRYLAGIVGPTEAEDLSQEVFLRISQALQAFRGESQLSTWIHRIATNAAIDRTRSPAFHRTEPGGLLDGSDPDELELGVAGRSAAAGPAPVELSVFRNERADCYQQFVRNLPLNYRTVVALSELEGMTTAEIAEILGLTQGAVKVRLHRGRARLLRELRAHCRAEDWL